MNSLRINGLQEKENENLKERVLEMAQYQLNVELEENGIEKIHRLGPKKPNSTRPIIVKFARFDDRDRVFRSRSNLRKSKEEMDQERRAEEFDPEIQLDTGNEDDDDDEDYTNVFINEDLTKLRSHLLWVGRKMKKERKILDCWSFNGKILFKDNERRIKPIKSENDFN
jgi:exosome complex exonuclease DIS3/RRP44